MLRIVSYNIRLGVDSSMTRIAEVMASAAPDVICLQEVGNDWIMGEKVDTTAIIAEKLDAPVRHYAPAIFQDGGEYGIALICKHKTVVEDCRQLPQYDDEPRVLLTTRIEAPEGPIRLMTSHLSIEPRDRLEQCSWIADRLEECNRDEPLPTVLVGDLNCELGSAELDDLCQRAALRCALVEVLGNHPPSFPTVDPHRAIDHILIDKSFFALRARVDPSLGSDHLAVWADLELL